MRGGLRGGADPLVVLLALDLRLLVEQLAYEHLEFRQLLRLRDLRVVDRRLADFDRQVDPLQGSACKHTRTHARTHRPLPPGGTSPHAPGGGGTRGTLGSGLTRW